MKDKSKKSHITLSLTQNSIYFQMNQKSYAGANSLGFKRFQERGNHKCGGRGQILIPPTKLKLIKSVNFTSVLENIPIFYSIFRLRNKSKIRKPMHIWLLIFCCKNSLKKFRLSIKGVFFFPTKAEKKIPQKVLTHSFFDVFVRKRIFFWINKK